MNATPPADADAERILIAAALTGQPIDPLARIISPRDFWEPRHEAIWAAIMHVHDNGQPIDIAAVRAALAASAARVDPLYLAQLYGEASLTADGTWHAERVHDLAATRGLAQALQQGLAAALDPALDYRTAADQALAAVEAATSGDGPAGLVTVGDVLPDVIDTAETGGSPALSTPWPDLDRLIGGIAPGRLVVIGARPSVGKSLAGTNLALHMAERHGRAALIASMEMPRQEVVQRLVSARARVDMRALMDGTLKPAEWDSLQRNFETIRRLPIWIEDASSQSVGSIRAAAREVARDRSDLALIVVDYLQLMAAPDHSKTATRAERLGAVTRGLKILARDTGACVVAMAQVNREGVKGGARPTMGDLRESGSIESDADQVILLHRPDDEVPEVEVLVDKNRWGPKGRLDLHLMGHYASLASVTRHLESV